MKSWESKRRVHFGCRYWAEGIDPGRSCGQPQVLLHSLSSLGAWQCLAWLRRLAQREAAAPGPAGSWAAEAYRLAATPLSRIQYCTAKAHPCLLAGCVHGGGGPAAGALGACRLAARRVSVGGPHRQSQVGKGRPKSANSAAKSVSGCTCTTPPTAPARPASTSVPGGQRRSKVPRPAAFAGSDSPSACPVPHRAPPPAPLQLGLPPLGHALHSPGLALCLGPAPKCHLQRHRPVVPAGEVRGRAAPPSHARSRAFSLLCGSKLALAESCVHSLCLGGWSQGDAPPGPARLPGQRWRWPCLEGSRKPLPCPGCCLALNPCSQGGAPGDQCGSGWLCPH